MPSPNETQCVPLVTSETFKWFGLLFACVRKLNLWRTGESESEATLNAQFGNIFSAQRDRWRAGFRGRLHAAFYARRREASQKR